jgi:hypothetical protein
MLHGSLPVFGLSNTSFVYKIRGDHSTEVVWAGGGADAAAPLARKIGSFISTSGVIDVV